MNIIKVELGKRGYPVVIGSKIDLTLTGQLKKLVGKGRIFVIYDAQVYALHGGRLDRILRKSSTMVSFAIPTGERTKNLKQLNQIRDFFLSEQITREDTIVAVGGGVTSDIIGYAAATTLRGINWVVIPTTLVGMVDAAIGGKTGVNHQRGKNLIGAFWQPRLVWCDTRYLMTLPRRELVAGLGEILKYAGLIGGPMMKQVETFIDRQNLYDLTRLQPIITSCASYKAAVVGLDENDRGHRMFLNLGHTFAHAIEAGAGFGRLRHGEALIIGLKAAVHMSELRYPKADAALERYRALVDLFQPMVPCRTIDLRASGQALSFDKKRGAAGLNFILLQKPGKPIITANVATGDMKKSLRFALEGFELVGKLDD